MALIDIISYSKQFSGSAQYLRLEFIANQANNEDDLRKTALSLAIESVKNNGYNTDLYETLCKRGGFPIDQDWLKSTKSRNDQLRAHLERDLSSAMANQVRDAIRRSLLQLGEFYHMTGDLSTAHSCYHRSLEYSSSSTDSHPSLEIAKIGIETRNFSIVEAYATRVKNALDSTSNAKKISQANALLAIACMRSGRYDEVLTCFQEIQDTEPSTFSSFTSLSELGAILCTCAFMLPARKTILSDVLDNQSLHNFVVAAPRFREALLLFTDVEYGQCLNCLNELSMRTKYDIFLAEPWPEMVTIIERKIFQNYVRPFKRVRLDKVAKDLEQDMTKLEDIIFRLIIDKHIPHMLDIASGCLVHAQMDDVNTEHSKCLHTMEEEIHATYQTITQLNLRRRGFGEHSAPSNEFLQAVSRRRDFPQDQDISMM